MSAGKLYFSYGTRASKVYWLALTLGLDVEIVRLRLDKREQKEPEYVKLNPHGAVPTFVTPDNQVLFESGAIIHYFLDVYDKNNKLTGAPGSPARNKFLIYNAFGAEAESALLDYLLNTRIMPEQWRNAAVAAAGKKKWDEKIKGVYERLLQGVNGFAGGDEFSALDVVVGYPLTMAAKGDLLSDSPALSAYLGRLSSHPNYIKAMVEPKPE